MNYIFDGSFLGLMTVVFDSFLNRSKLVNVEHRDQQLSLFVDAIYVDTDKEKAKRVVNYIKKEISEDFYRGIQQAFMSSAYNKDTIIVKIIHQVSVNGKAYLEQEDKLVKTFNKIVRSVRDEAKRITNIISFKKMDEDIYFAVIKPKSDILSILMASYKNKMKVQRFAIYDAVRSKVSYFESGKIRQFDISIDKVYYPDLKEEFNHLWESFYHVISLERRQKYNLDKLVVPSRFSRQVVAFNSYIDEPITSKNYERIEKISNIN